MNDEQHASTEALQAGLSVVQHSPKIFTVLDLIVRRPSVDAREVVDERAGGWTHGSTVAWGQGPGQETV